MKWMKSKIFRAILLLKTEPRAQVICRWRNDWTATSRPSARSCCSFGRKRSRSRSEIHWVLLLLLFEYHWFRIALRNPRTQVRKVTEWPGKRFWSKMSSNPVSIFLVSFLVPSRTVAPWIETCHLANQTSPLRHDVLYESIWDSPGAKDSS